jgi:hypothetical protein
MTSVMNTTDDPTVSVSAVAPVKKNPWFEFQARVRGLTHMSPPDAMRLCSALKAKKAYDEWADKDIVKFAFEWVKDGAGETAAGFSTDEMRRLEALKKEKKVSSKKKKEDDPVAVEVVIEVPAKVVEAPAPAPAEALKKEKKSAAKKKADDDPVTVEVVIEVPAKVVEAPAPAPAPAPASAPASAEAPKEKKAPRKKKDASPPPASPMTTESAQAALAAAQAEAAAAVAKAAEAKARLEALAKVEEAKARAAAASAAAAEAAKKADEEQRAADAAVAALSVPIPAMIEHVEAAKKPRKKAEKKSEEAPAPAPAPVPVPAEPADRRSKLKIPKHIKNLVWNKYIGADNATAKCVCCRQASISNTSFDCGHVIAEANGGDMNINNLRPICRDCNAGMGTRSMNDFTTEFFGWMV